MFRGIPESLTETQLDDMNGVVRRRNLQRRTQCHLRGLQPMSTKVFSRGSARCRHGCCADVKTTIEGGLFFCSAERAVRCPPYQTLSQRIAALNYGGLLPHGMHRTHNL